MAPKVGFASPSVSRAKPLSHGKLTILIAVVLLGFALRVARLDHLPLWLDETSSVYISRAGLASVFARLEFDQVPGYFLALRGWMDLAGRGEFAVRYLSVLLGIASLASFFLLLRPLGQRVALVGVLGLAISPFHVFYSREARMHVMASLLSILALWCLCRAVRGRTAGLWAAYALLAGGAIYSFAYSAFLLVGSNVPIVISARYRSRGWLAGNLALTLLCLPWALFDLRRISAYVAQRADAMPAGLAVACLPTNLCETQRQPHVLTYLSSNLEHLLLGSTVDDRLGWVPEIMLGVFAALGCYTVLRRRSLLGQILAGGAFGLIGAAYLVTLRLPLFYDRYLLSALPAILGFVALGLAACSQRWRWTFPAAIPGLAVVALSLVNMYFNPLYQRDNYPEAFSLVQSAASPDELFIYDPTSQAHALDYYRPPLRLPAIGLPADQAGRPATEATLARLAGAHDGVWLMMSEDEQHWVESWLDGHELMVQDKWFGYSLHLKHYRLGPRPPDSADAAVPGGVIVNSDFGSLRLLQVAAYPEGDSLPVKMSWYVNSRPAKDYILSLQLFDTNGRRWAQHDASPIDGAPTTSWLANAIYHVDAIVPLGHLPEGTYELRATIYAADGTLAGNQQSILHVEIRR